MKDQFSGDQWLFSTMETKPAFMKSRNMQQVAQAQARHQQSNQPIKPNQPLDETQDLADFDNFEDIQEFKASNQEEVVEDDDGFEII